MFRKHRVRNSVILLTVGLLVTLVSYSHGGWSGIDHRVNTKATNISSLPNAPPEEMAVNGVTVAALYKYVRFHGTASFPDGTILLSQLYEDQKPLHWWPVAQPIIVENGTWAIKVLLGTRGAPSDLLSGPFYHFIVYRPLIKAGLGFDLVGPPPAQ